MNAQDAKNRLKSLASPEVAKVSARFFKTGQGEYGEGDAFIGIRVPMLRLLAHEFKNLALKEVQALLSSPIHEERHLALIILVLQVVKCSESHRADIYDLYLRSTRFINNWDLVDCSAPHIVGGYLLNKARKPLVGLTKSNSLWERRIAIVSTQHFIRHNDYRDTLAISQRLFHDKEDLIHKAAGWMLREVGKRDQDVLITFLDQYGSAMPRTMLRYAIERFPPGLRQFYLSMKRV